LAEVDYIALVTIAFLGSLGHCSGMCGGFVVAYTSTKISPQWRKSYQGLAHILYSFGRVTSYTFLGVIFGFLGSVVAVGMTTKGVLFIFIGLIMILMGLSLMGKIKFLSFLESSIAQSSIFQKSFQRIFQKESLGSFYLLGILNGFIPCGFVYFFLAGAVATASPVDGALVMFLFGLSTIPILFSIGFVIGFLKSGKFRAVMMNIASVMVILFGLFMIFKASMLLSGKMPMKGMDGGIMDQIVREK
jgi:sulfite exporter TauE/SafE